MRDLLRARQRCASPWAGWLLCAWSVVAPLRPAGAAIPDELKVKRAEVFQFTEKLTVTRAGDATTIRFTSKGFCDATVAIENRAGRIIRHLASGVLGPNAPAPFQKNSLAQTVVWDGKDDQGHYVESPTTECTVRVSLGLRPQFERTLYWSPHKRYGSVQLLAVGPEGAYVTDGRGVDFVRLFDHEGNYVRTVYPFPTTSLDNIRGLNWYDYPQGYRLPRKGGLYQTTLLDSGPNFHSGHHGVARTASAGASIALRGTCLAMAHVFVNRLTTDGSSGRSQRGAKTGHVVKSIAEQGMDIDVGPASMAFSPDGKTLYLTGYLWRSGSWNATPGCWHALFKLNYEKDDPPELLVGAREKWGVDNAHFTVPTSVDTDAAGRVYVTDFMNDRVQVFDAAGAFLASLAVDKPAQVCIGAKTGEIWVFSYPLIGIPHDVQRERKFDPKALRQTVTRFAPFPETRRLSSEPFPMGYTEDMGFEVSGHVFRVAVDEYTPEPTIWVVGRKHFARGAEFGFSGGYDKAESDGETWKAGVRLQRKVDGQWKPVRSFGDDAVKEAVRPVPTRHNIQHCYVHPLTGKLYLAEPDSGPTGKASNDWLEINPNTGAIRVIHLPFNALDAAFDLNGLVYLRSTDMIARYDMANWREVPWDYGEERASLGNDGGIHGRSTSVTAGLKMPSVSPVCYHQGGISVAPNGNVLASCAYRYEGISSGHLAGKDMRPRQVYKPRVYPGRINDSTAPCLHVWDAQGRLKFEDALPGVGQCDGVGLDRDNNVYVMQAPSRVYGGKRYFNEMSETLIKARVNKGKIIASTPAAPIALGASDRPTSQPDLESTRTGAAWAPGVSWLYGGVGFAGFNMIGHGGGCACWFARFTLDYFARSIAPEPDQYRVAMLDSAGNLILRIGQYGNVDDGRPLVLTGGPTHPRSIGGDEVGLIHACFVGTHTDRRIFIADMGNARLVSVKLGYHAEEKVALKDLAVKGN